MKVKRISESDIQRKDCLKIFFVERPVLFGIIVDVGEDALIVIGWDSELVDPLIQKQGDELFVGVDNGFAICDIVQNIPSVVFCLSSRFVVSIIRQTSVVVIAELEVIVLNRVGYSILKHLNLPDVVEDYMESETGVKIICMNELEFNIVC